MRIVFIWLVLIGYFKFKSVNWLNVVIISIVVYLLTRQGSHKATFFKHHTWSTIDVSLALRMVCPSFIAFT